MGIAVSTLERIYREVLGDYRNENEFLWKHRGGFVHFVHGAVADGLLSPEYSRKNFKLERLSYALDPARDRLLSADTLENLVREKLLRDGQGLTMETPQYYWMRQAMAGALSEPNPTRAALTLHEKYSRDGETGRAAAYGPDVFNGQRLLFDVTKPVAQAGTTDVPQHYFDHGWAVISGVNDEFEAIELQEKFINSATGFEATMPDRLRGRVQLAKADQIPVCDDIVATSFQVLHFDMGHPFAPGEGQLFVSHVGIYLPKATRHKVTASTRVVELEGILRHLGLPAAVIDARLLDYVQKSGDGWTDHNTGRLAAFVRFLDALSDQPELADQIDKTVGQWFGTERVGEGEARRLEADFMAKHGLELGNVEHQVQLRPGQLLILDNSRVVHGRMGKRRAKELFNYMWGVKEIAPEDIEALRQHICRQAAG